VRFVLHLNQASAALQQTGLTTVFEVPALAETVQPLVLQLRKKDYHGPFIFEVRVEDEAGRFHLERNVEFLGPDANLSTDEKDVIREHQDPNHS
jgi:hypothetical protein